MSSVKENFIWNTAYQVVRIATPLVTTPYLTRVLGSGPLGVYSYTYTIAMYFTYFVLLGLNQYGNREIAKARDDRGRLSKVFWSIYAGQAAVGIAVTLVYVAFSLVQEGITRVCLLIWIGWVLAEVADIGWLFYGLEEFRLITIRNVLIRVVVMVGIFVLVKSSDDLWLYCALQAFAFVLNSAVLWPIVRKRMDFYMPTPSEVLSHIPPSLVLFAPVIAISCYTQLNKILLGNITDMHQVAFYDNADKIVLVPLAIIQSLGTVLLPRMSNVLSGGDNERAAAYVSDSLWVSMAMAFGLVFGISGVSHVFVPVFFGEGFEPCEILLPLLSLIIPICAVSSVFGNQYLIPHERDTLYLKSVLCGAVANVILCVALIPPLGAVGAAVATVVAELVVSGVQFLYVKGELPVGRYALEVLPFVVAGVAEYLSIRAAALLPLGGALLLGAEFLVGATVYLVLGFGYLIARGDPRLRFFGLSRFVKVER